MFLQFSFGTDKFDKYWKTYLAPPNGPPQGSAEHMVEIYAHLGVDPSSSTGYDKYGTLEESSEEESSESCSSDSEEEEPFEGIWPGGGTEVDGIAPANKATGEGG